MRDLKMLEALEVDYENNKVKVDLSKLYSNIDWYWSRVWGWRENKYQRFGL